MQKSFEPDGYTMQTVVNACAGLGSLSLGTRAHAFLCDLLIEMYCKCGSLGMAEQSVPRDTKKRHLALWNAMILGIATHGRADEALDCFDRMVRGSLFLLV